MVSIMTSDSLTWETHLKHGKDGYLVTMETNTEEFAQAQGSVKASFRK